MNNDNQQPSESAVYAKFQRGVPFAIMQDQLIEFEDSYQARNLMQGGSIPDFKRMQDTYCFQFSGTVELITQYRKNDWWEDCHMSVYQQWRDDGRAKDIRKVARLIAHPQPASDTGSLTEEDIQRLHESNPYNTGNSSLTHVRRAAWLKGAEYEHRHMAAKQAELIAKAPELLAENQRQAAELDKLRTENARLRESLEEMYNTLSSSDIFLCQYLPEKESVYKDEAWLKKAKSALSGGSK